MRKDGPPAVPEKKEMVADKAPVVEQPAKKKRAFVEEADVFDFSGMKKSAIDVGEENKKSNSATLSKQSSVSKKSADNDDGDFSMGGFFQGKSVQLGGSKNLNAKKLDIDFGDGDDFFN